jgi:hypothetical protein
MGGLFAMTISRRGGLIFSETYNYNINRLSREGVFTEHLVNVDHRQDLKKVERSGLCYLRFIALMQRIIGHFRRSNFRNVLYMKRYPIIRMLPVDAYLRIGFNLKNQLAAPF